MLFSVVLSRLSVDGFLCFTGPPQDATATAVPAPADRSGRESAGGPGGSEGVQGDVDRSRPPQPSLAPFWGERHAGSRATRPRRRRRRQAEAKAGAGARAGLDSGLSRFRGAEVEGSAGWSPFNRMDPVFRRRPGRQDRLDLPPLLGPLPAPARGRD